jgi:hypothetical protein
MQSHHPTQRYCHGGNPISTHILKRLKKWLEDESQAELQSQKNAKFYPVTWWTCTPLYPV